MAPKLLIKVRLTDIREEADGVRSFEFRPVVRAELPCYPGGSHVVLVLPDGRRRSYSLCGDPSDRLSYRIAVLRQPDGQGGSLALHDGVVVGQEMYLTHPQPDFRLDEAAERHLFIAGGIGITPVVGMLRDRAHRSYAEVHYAVSRRSRAAFLDVVADLADSVAVYSADEGRRLDVTGLLREPRTGTRVYCCGPPRLMAAVSTAASAWPAGSVRTEQFTGLDRDAARKGRPFDVELALSGRTLRVGAAESLLDVLRREGVPIDSACEAGVCRSCRVDVLGGRVVHRDLVLSAEQRESSLLACVSRGEGPLRLQL